jgi:hypothetical protein
MPRVAPIVRSTRYEHAINTLVAKRAEISGLIPNGRPDAVDRKARSPVFVGIGGELRQLVCLGRGLGEAHHGLH